MKKHRWYPSDCKSILLSQPNSNDFNYRLFCFSYAGGHAGQYFPWLSLIPDEIQLCAIELPGRATRMNEPLVNDMSILVDQLMPDFLHHIDQRPINFFGHSIGGYLAF